MTYRIGDVEVQGAKPSNVIVLAFGRKTADGGKARIKRRRLLFPQEGACDLSMLHADNGMPSDVAYCAPDGDCA
jgi:hypothetical protein